MAQIKVLNLCGSHSLSELSHKDAKNVNGGAFGFGYGVGYSIGRAVTGRGSFTEAVSFTGATTYLGSFAGPYGTSLSTLAKS